MYEKYLEQLEEAGKIRNLKERSINCYKNYVSYFLKYQNKNPEELACQDVRTFLLAKKEEGQWKELTLSGIEFIRRFLMHVPPRRFVRIRPGIMGFYVPAANTKSSLYAGISSDAKNIFQSSGIRRCQKY